MSSKKNKKQSQPARLDTVPDKPNTANAKIISEKINKAISEDDAGTIALKEETLKWLFSIIGAVIVYWVVATIIQSVYHPDINAIIKEANEVSFTHDSRPEPMEILLFRAGVLTLTIGTWLFYILFSKIKLVKDLAVKPFFTSFVSVCVVAVAALIYVDFAAGNPFAPGGAEQPQNSRDTVAKTNFSFYFDGLFLGDYLLAYLFIIVPAIALIFYFGLKKNHWENNPLYKKIVMVVTYGVLGIVLLTIFRINIFEFPYTFENKYDFNAVYYSVTQAYAGSAMLTNGFTNTYGLYPHFLSPIFSVIGLSVYKFTVVISVLIVLTFIFNILFLKKYVKNNIIWFLGCCAIIFFPYFDFRLLTNFDSAFVFPPIRYIIPGTLTFLAAMYLNKRSPVIYYLAFVLMGFFVLWNPEIGMVCYIAWVVFNVYNDFYTPEGKIGFKKIAMHILCAVGGIILAFNAYKLGIYLSYGVWPDIGSLFSYIAHLGKGGNGSLPMVQVHPWNINALLLTLGFAYATIRFYRKEITPKSSIILMVSLISLGMFVYFQGRSHNWPFAISSTYSLILLTLLGDELWEKIREKDFKSVLPLHVLFIVFIFLISFSFIELVYNFGKISDLVSQTEDKEKAADEQAKISANTDFIVNHSREKEKIYILSGVQYQGLYFDGYKRRSAFNPGQQDMILYTDLNRMERQIIDSGYNAFIEPERIGFTFLTRPFAALSACYEVKTSNLAMYMLTKRTTKIPVKTYFTDENNVVIHRKYTDDTAGIKKRIDDALGVGQANLGTSFSVAVLFYSDTQMFQYSTLAGNINDTGGFVIANILHSANYFFGINGKGTAAPMPMNQWVYLVMNVYPDHLEVLRNGESVATYALPAPMRQSPNKLAIGNLGFMRYYVGAISEIAIYSKTLDKAQVEGVWDEIKKM